MFSVNTTSNQIMEDLLLKILLGTLYSRMDQVKFLEDGLYKIEGVWSALGRPYPIKFFKGCLPQIFLGPFLNTLSQMLDFHRPFGVKHTS